MKFSKPALTIAFAALLATACTPVAPTAPAGPQTGPITISFWHPLKDPNEVAAVQTVLDKFHAAHPDITQAVVAGSVASGSADITPSAQSPGPPEGSTLTLPYWLFVQGFQRFNMGYASALAVMLFLVSLAFIALLLRRRSGFAGGAA
jgi:multiple sugar transport system permease protein